MSAIDVVSLLGASLRCKVDGKALSASDALGSAQVVGIFSAHMSQEASQEVAEALTCVLAEVNGAGAPGAAAAAEGADGSESKAAAEDRTPPAPRFVVVVLPQDVAPDASAVMEGVPGAFVPDCSKAELVAGEVALRRKLCLSMAVRIPELLLVDAASGRLLSSSAGSAAIEGRLTGESFPAGWRGNVFRAGRPVSVAGGSARVSASAMLRCSLFPGDPVTVRSLRTGATLCLAAGGKDEAAEADIAGLGSAADALPDVGEDDVVVLPAAAMAALGVVEGSDVLLDQSAEPSQATGVVVLPLPTGSADSSSSAGVGGEGKGEGEGAGEEVALANEVFGLGRRDAGATVAAALMAAMAPAGAATGANAASAGGGGTDDDTAEAAAAEAAAATAASLESLVGSGGVPGWLLEHVRQSDCAHALATAGQVLMLRKRGAAPDASPSPAELVEGACGAGGATEAPRDRVARFAEAAAGAYSGFVVSAVEPKDFCVRVGPSAVVRAAGSL